MGRQTAPDRFRIARVRREHQRREPHVEPFIDGETCRARERCDAMPHRVLAQHRSKTCSADRRSACIVRQQPLDRFLRLFGRARDRHGSSERVLQHRVRHRNDRRAGRGRLQHARWKPGAFAVHVHRVLRRRALKRVRIDERDGRVLRRIAALARIDRQTERLRSAQQLLERLRRFGWRQDRARVRRECGADRRAHGRLRARRHHEDRRRAQLSAPLQPQRGVRLGRDDVIEERRRFREAFDGPDGPGEPEDGRSAVGAAPVDQLAQVLQPSRVGVRRAADPVLPGPVVAAFRGFDEQHVRTPPFEVGLPIVGPERDEVAVRHEGARELIVEDPGDPKVFWDSRLRTHAGEPLASRRCR